MNKEQRTKNKEQRAGSREQRVVCDEQFNPLFFVNCSLVIDLQWFADDNDEDAPGKTIDPTEQKLKKLREEGQVAKSQELVGAIGLLLPAIVLLILAPSMLRTCVEMVRFFFLRAVELDPTKDAIIATNFLRYFLRLVTPILIVAFISAVFSNMAQVNGWVFAVKAITPDFSKALPKFGQYFKRIFSIEGVFNLGKSLVKIIIIGTIAFLFIRADIEKLVNLQKAHPYTSLTIVAGIAIRMMIVVAVLLIALSVADLYFQKFRFRERHKMTPREVKEERKQSESDPQIQGRIRARFRDMLRQNLAQEVPKADVVITNPTHFAVALRYDTAFMPGPMVVAKGEDEIAMRIRKIAKDNDVALVENKPLARALYEETGIGEIIPLDHWKAVAAILVKIGFMDEKRQNKRAA